MMTGNPHRYQVLQKKESACAPFRTLKKSLIPLLVKIKFEKHPFKVVNSTSFIANTAAFGSMQS